MTAVGNLPEHAGEDRERDKSTIKTQALNRDRIPLNARTAVTTELSIEHEGVHSGNPQALKSKSDCQSLIL